MSLFAIGDLHLSGGDDKPMDIFGPQWDGHFFKISENWEKTVRPEDTVLIPGDISWAMRLEDARADLETIGKLPGRKILCKGNHDYWWNSITQVRSILPESMTALQHDAADLGDRVVCGTRGWLIPTEENPLTPSDQKIYRREAQRLEIALDTAFGIAAGRPVIVLMHYPPLTAGTRETLFTKLLEERGVSLAVYGHLHGEGLKCGYNGEWHGVQYRLTSCDGLDFSPLCIG